MKVFFTTFFCIISLFLCAQQKAPVKKKSPIKNKSVEVSKAKINKNAIIKGRMLDENANPVSNVMAEAYDDSTGLVIASSESESSGRFSISLPQAKKYVIVFNKPSYFFQLVPVAIPDSSGYENDLSDISLVKVEIGKKIVLNSIFFDLNQSTIKKESVFELNEIVKLMSSVPSLQIEISGHTDNVASLNYNKQFSEQRAKAIMDELISKGCDKSRLNFKGLGASQPIGSNDTEEGRLLNNRMEILVLNVESTEEPAVEEKKDLVQHEYIYHSALKKEVPKDSTKTAHRQENKDTTTTVVKNAESIDSTKAQSITVNKDTTTTVVKNGESIDSTKAPSIQANKDTTTTVVKNGESIDSTMMQHTSEIKDTTATIVKQGETIDSTGATHIQGIKDTTAKTTIGIKQVEKVDSTIAAHPRETKDTTLTLAKTEEPQTSVIHSLKMEIKNEGKQINSAFADYTPLLSADGHMMIFTSNRPLTKKEIQKGKEGLEQVYVTYYDDKNEKWLEPKLLGPSINLPDMNNSAVSLSNDGQHLLIYHAGTDVNGNGDIFESQLFTEEWSEPVRLPSAINSEENETSANISPDGRTIYFVSDRKGGLGGKDIWYTTQDDKGKFGEAINMGDAINSPQDEESIFIHPLGNVIFFSSKGHNSLGGYDIFMSVYDEITKKWSKAENLGTPINTPQDDISFILEGNGKSGHYASSKPGGYGGLDIYNIAFFEDLMKVNVTLLQGRVINKNGNSVGALISVKNKTTGQLSEPVKSNKITGQYFLSLAPGKKYEIKVTAYGYNPYVESFDIPYKSVTEEIFNNFVLESKNAFLSSRVIDEKGNPIRNAQIEIVDKATNQVIAQPKSNSAGYSRVSVPFGKAYTVVFSKSGYLFQSANAVIPDSVGYEKDLKDITLQKVEVGKKIVLNNIFFELNQPTMRKESVLEIQRVLKLMSEMATLQIEISGHTDNVGAITYKKQLSEQRAKVVVDNLIVKGCDKNRLKSVGYGPAMPIAINFTQEGRQLNNRIELKVLKVDLAAEQIAEAKRLKETPVIPEKLDEEQKEIVAITQKIDETIEPTDEFKILEVKNIGKQVNSLFADYAPLISSDKHTLTFTSRRPLSGKNLKKGKEGPDNVFVTYYDDKNEKWLEPKILEPTINLPEMSNSAVALPNDGQQMLVYHCASDPSATGDIYEHLLYGKEWTAPVRSLPKPINSEENETSVSISPDGGTVYFVSDRKGGLGGKDIWYAVQDEDGIFGEAINMGPNINTGGDEESVFLNPNGGMLFFSSTDHNSMGGYDIFMSAFDETNQTWMKPENIGLPINTYGNDVSFTLSLDGKTGYYASSKPEKIGDLDINSVEFSENILRKNTTLLKGNILNKSNVPVLTTIFIKNKITGKIVDSVKSNKANGRYFISLVSGKKYEIEYSAYGYTTQTEPLDIPYKAGFQKITKDIILESNSAFIISKVSDDRGYPLGGVQIKIVDDVTSQVIAKPLSDTTGNSIIAVPYGRAYNVVFGKPGYFFQSIYVDIPDSVGYEKDLKDIILEKVEVGKKVGLNAVFTDLNQMVARKQTIAELQLVAKLINETLSLQIEISGHTDSIGTLKNNQKVSELRAKIVMDSLIRRGCDKNRLKYKGYGPTEPIASNSTAEGRSQNNRVEIKVLNIDLAAEQQAIEKRMKDSLAAAKKIKITSIDNKENQDPGQQQKKRLGPSISERLLKYDKDKDGVISYEELLAAMDSTRTELNKVLKPVVTPEKVVEEKQVKEEVKEGPENKTEVITPVKEETVLENKTVSPTIEEKQLTGQSDSLAGKSSTSSNETEKQVLVQPDSLAGKSSPLSNETEKQLTVQTDSLTGNTSASLNVADSLKTSPENKDTISTAIHKERKLVPPGEGQAKIIPTKPIPERFKKYDKDNDGVISYDEVLRVIDSFLDEEPKSKEEAKKDTTVADLLDFYFDQ